MANGHVTSGNLPFHFMVSHKLWNVALCLLLLPHPPSTSQKCICVWIHHMPKLQQVLGFPSPVM